MKTWCESRYTMRFLICKILSKVREDIFEHYPDIREGSANDTHEMTVHALENDPKISKAIRNE